MGRSMTPTNITANPILLFEQSQHIKNLKIHRIYHPAIHDIRLSFVYNGLRSLLLLPKSELISNIDNGYNKDITLKDITHDDITIKTTIHNSDNVAIMVAFTDTPIPVDYLGLSNLSNDLTRVEERLQRIIDEYNKSSVNKEFENEGNRSNVTLEDAIKTKLDMHELPGNDGPSFFGIHL